MAAFAINVQKVLDDIKTSRSDGVITAQEILLLSTDFTEALAEALHDFSGTQAEYDAFVIDCQTVLRVGLMGLDIPGVPSFAENYIKEQLVVMLRPLLDHFRPVRKMGFAPPVPA